MNLLELNDLQKDNLPKEHYMDLQPELSWDHRGMLLEWLLALHMTCPFNPESFFLCANLVDRFCTHNPGISFKKYQLVGIACFMIAGSKVTVEEVQKAERYVLKVLNWDLNYNGPLGWLRRASRADGLDPRTRTLAKYLLEIGIFEPRLLTVPPSLLSASAYFLARLCIGEERWVSALRVT